MAATARSRIHMVLFAATLTVALCIVTDMEYPRLGLIRIEAFDDFLSDVLERMQEQIVRLYRATVSAAEVRSTDRSEAMRSSTRACMPLR